MAPKRRNKVVSSVVKTKVVQETVEITTAIVADQQPAAAPALIQDLPGVDVSGGSTVVHVEVTTPDGDTGGRAGVNVNKKPKKRGRGSGGAREDDGQGKKPPASEEEATPVSLQSQETQDPNEQEAEIVEDDAGKKKKKQRRQETTNEEQQPETPRVASERKKTAKEDDEQGAAGKHQQQTPHRRRRRRRLGATSPRGDAGMGGVGGYKLYVWRVLKQVHPELGASGRAMQVLDMMMADMFERLADEAARLSKVSGRMTLTSREVQSAVRLVLPGDLAKHAISEGVKAVSKYTAA